MRPRPDTLENNSVCMSEKTKILEYSQNIVFCKQPIHNRNDCRWVGYIVNIN